MKNALLPFLLATIICCQAAPILPEEAENHHYPNQIFTGPVPAAGLGGVRAGVSRRESGRAAWD
jgi:hypothetical protein